MASDEMTIEIFYLAAWHMRQEPSNKAYWQAQEAIDTHPCELSVYRFFFGSQPIGWLTIVVGELPPQPLLGLLETALSTGEPQVLAGELLLRLVIRHFEKTVGGGKQWSESHKSLTIKRKYPPPNDQNC